MTDEQQLELQTKLAVDVAGQFDRGDPMAVLTLIQAAATITVTWLPAALAAKLIRDVAEFSAASIEERFAPEQGAAVQ